MRVRVKVSNLGGGAYRIKTDYCQQLPYGHYLQLALEKALGASWLCQNENWYNFMAGGVEIDEAMVDRLVRKTFKTFYAIPQGSGIERIRSYEPLAVSFRL